LERSVVHGFSFGQADRGALNDPDRRPSIRASRRGFKRSSDTASLIPNRKPTIDSERHSPASCLASAITESATRNPAPTSSSRIGAMASSRPSRFARRTRFDHRSSSRSRSPGG
jgi:hypothetical protein